MSKKEELDRAIEDARTRTMSADEREKQRRSFVYGNTKIEYECLTRDAVDEIAERQAPPPDSDG